MASTPSQSTPQPPSALVLPEGLSADSIDTIPVLSAILSRLQSLSASPAANAASPPAASPAQIGSGTGPLTIKDIPTATDDLKHKLQRARAQVKELPDIDRSVAEQEEEIRELEERIRRQREVLEQLKDAGIKALGELGGAGNNTDSMET
jgi:small-conductance mechanosensitive channel